MSNLRIGIPSKGRLSELARELLHQAGLSFRRQERSLFALVREVPAEITFLRADDIPVLCAEGAIDIGITGSDQVMESQVNVQTRLALGMGTCRLALCVPESSAARRIADLAGKRVATSFPRLTARFFGENRTEAHLVHLSGSVEVMTALGVAEAIVDLVETGSTLAANHLRVLAEIGSFESVLIQNPQSGQGVLIDRVARRLEGVVIARNYSLLEYNIAREKLPEAEAITPGFRSPTVNALEDPGWCAVRAMVRRSQVIEVMEKLEKLGASAILETVINNCRL